MKPLRLRRLPENIRKEIRAARRVRGWSQLELGRQAGLTQRQVSNIETGAIAPRSDTLIDMVRVLDLDLALVPKALLPAVQALVRDYRTPDAPRSALDRPLYAVDDGGEEGTEDVEDIDPDAAGLKMGNIR